MDTREKIIAKALDLFNTLGAHSVTTNHIAREMGISPGNLYYHFRNKEEIIREIFTGIIADFDVLWGGNIAGDGTAATFIGILDRMCDLYYKYRFFYLEIASLLAQDEELMSRYRKNLVNRFAQQSVFYESLISRGFFKKQINSDQLTRVMTGAWIISDQWLTHLFISGRTINPESIRECLPVLFIIIRPYLTNKALNELNPAQ